MKLSAKISRLFSKIAVKDLMTYIAATMGIILIGDMVSGYQISPMLMFDRTSILGLQIWRVVTFLGLPTNYGPIFGVITIMFYFSIGRDLEGAWGSRNVTAYLAVGWLLTVIAGFIGGFADNTYLYLSLFCAYAALMPNSVFMLFFLIPVKAKWLAWADAVFMIWTLIFGFAYQRLCVAAALAVFLIFFGEDFFRPVLNKWKHRDFIHEMKRNKIRISGKKDD